MSRLRRGQSPRVYTDYGVGVRHSIRQAPGADGGPGRDGANGAPGTYIPAQGQYSDDESYVPGDRVIYDKETFPETGDNSGYENIQACTGVLPVGDPDTDSSLYWVKYVGAGLPGADGLTIGGGIAAPVPPWTAGTTYAIGQLSLYYGTDWTGVYACMVNHTSDGTEGYNGHPRADYSAFDPDPAVWVKFIPQGLPGATITGPRGPRGYGVQPKNPWNDTATYDKGDLVRHDYDLPGGGTVGASWIATYQSHNWEPGFTNDAYPDGKWNMVCHDGKNGADGHTPVLGVDYHNGVDGTDGHTPVLGVDYHNGVDGTDGHDALTWLAVQIKGDGEYFVPIGGAVDLNDFACINGDQTLASWTVAFHTGTTLRTLPLSLSEDNMLKITVSGTGGAVGGIALKS